MQLNIVSVVLTICVLCDGEIYTRECPVWKEEVKRIETQEPRLNVTCHVNTPCSGLDCTGLYSYEGSLVTGKYEKNICFGLSMNPCKDPTKLTVYIEQISDNISFTHTVTANQNSSHDETEIPGAKESINFGGIDGEVTVTVVTDFKSEMHLIEKYVTLGVQLQPKVTVGTYPYYPDELKVWLVKDVEVPVPQCDSLVVLPTHKSGICPKIAQADLTKYKPDPPKKVKVVMTGTDFAVVAWTPAPPKDGVSAESFMVHYTDKDGKEQEQEFVTSPGIVVRLTVNTNYTFYVMAHNQGGRSNPSKNVTAATTQKDTGKTSGLFHPCDPSNSIYEACDSYQYCDLVTKRCKCIFGLSDLTTCFHSQTMSTTNKPVVLTDLYEPGTPEMPAGLNKKGSVVTGVCSGLAVLVAVVVTVAIIFYYRKKKAQYAEHTLLRNEEDTEDDGDVPPIIP